MEISSAWLDSHSWTPEPPPEPEEPLAIDIEDLELGGEG